MSTRTQILVLSLVACLAWSALASATITQKGNLRVAVQGKLSPKKLPRKGTAPISVSVGGEISTTDATLPLQLKALHIELNRNGQIDNSGLPTCQYSKIQPGSTSRALAGCRSSLVGEGSFADNITSPAKSPTRPRAASSSSTASAMASPSSTPHVHLQPPS